MSTGKNWTILDNKDYINIWNFVYDNLLFSPNKLGFELIKLPTPNKLYNISRFYNEGFSEEYYNDLHEKTLKVFKESAVYGELLYALNWQHDCYKFNPKLPFELDNFDEWLIPIFPNGDYLFFITEDFSNGIFSDGINMTISFYGDIFLNSFGNEKPKMFTVQD